MRRTATRLTTKSAPLTTSLLVGSVALAVGMIAPPTYATTPRYAPRDVPAGLVAVPASGFPLDRSFPETRRLATTGAGDLVALALLAGGLLAAGFFLTLGVLQVEREEE